MSGNKEIVTREEFEEYKDNMHEIIVQLSKIIIELQTESVLNTNYWRNLL